MKLLSFSLALIFIGLFFSACIEDDDTETLSPEPVDYIIFGHFYGECWGEMCVETYKLTGTQLFEDTLDQYAGSTYSFIELEDSLFQAVHDLGDFIPSQLLLEPDSTFGCPDCYDQGGVIIQLEIDGDVRTWRMDQTTDDIPEYLQELVEKINEKIGVINN